MKPFDQYTNPSLAIDLVVFGYYDDSLNVLLLNRKEAPFTGKWTLPGAFLQMHETFLDTCYRVLDTKLGMANCYLEQLYSFDAPERDPRGRVIAVAHYALINPSKFEIVAGNMANDVKWFPVNELPKLGFDHKHILDVALTRLRSKMLYNPVGFELLNEEFTMPELHSLYETVLETTIDRRNFRRKILDSGYLVSVGTRREGSQNRPPELYQFNKELKPNKFQINIDLS